MNIFIIGLGLIGGSYAKTMREKYPSHVFYGIDTNEEHIAQAIAMGLIDYSVSFEALKEADLVIVSIPVDASTKLMGTILDVVNEDCLVMDVGSTKASVCDVVREHPKRRQFLATHPIAGTEYSGPKAAVEGLYFGKTNILCEIEKTAPKLQQIAMQLFIDLGMRIRYMDPVAHDKHIAYVSHLSHISSFMLGKTVIEKEQNEMDIFDMAGSGFASTVRLAKSSPKMWAPIFENNKTNVIASLEEYIANLEAFKNLLVEDRFHTIEQQMQDTNKIKEILKDIE